MIKEEKTTAFLGKMAALAALFLLMLFAVPQTVHAAAYELYIGSTQVTDANKDDILGDGKASYDPGKATLYLNGVSIGEDNSHYDGEYNYSLYSGTDVVKNLDITGNNSFASTDHGMLFKVMGPTSSDRDFANHSLMITGSGTLTSTAAGDSADNDIAAMTVVGEDNPDKGTGKGGVFMGKEDGTGPTLKLTGCDIGADFYETGRVTMQGGTIIAKATGTPGTGVYLPLISSIGGYTYFNGGTIAGYGTYDEIENSGGAFDGSGDVSETQLGMQRVYPDPEKEETNYDAESGWCVVGMTQGDHAADTQAVLSELGLDSSGGGTDPGTDPDTPGTDPTNPDTPDTPGTGEGNRYHTDTVPDSGANIDVLGFTKAGIVYSVDVEWGAMTFQYEKSSWDAERHITKAGRGWVVYDNARGMALGNVQDAINRITVTNHSNAGVFATLSYTGNGGYADIQGGFVTKADDTETDFTAAADTVSAYLTLTTADNNKGTEEGEGKATVGSVYFMPSGIGTTDGAVNDITQWTKIGKITVGILTQAPQSQP